MHIILPKVIKNNSKYRDKEIHNNKIIMNLWVMKIKPNLIAHILKNRFCQKNILINKRTN